MATSNRHLSAYGYRAKLGLIVPPTNTVNEAEWARMVPEGVTFHTVRMALHADTHSTEGARLLEADIDAAIGMLAQARIDVVAYACTAGSMINPPERLPAAMRARSGIAAVTTAAALVAALHALRARRISVATPYHDALNRHEAAFLEENDVAVARILGLGIGAHGPAEYPRIAETRLEAVAAHARAAFFPGSDALMISCTDFPTLSLVPQLEAEFGVPVVTSNQATFWASLRAAGIDDRFDHFGKLLQVH